MKEDLLSALYLEFVNRVNEVGVDINRAIAFPHTAPLLQFVCGLGPRKSSHLLKVSHRSLTNIYVHSFYDIYARRIVHTCIHRV